MDPFPTTKFPTFSIRGKLNHGLGMSNSSRVEVMILKCSVFFLPSLLDVLYLYSIRFPSHPSVTSEVGLRSDFCLKSSRTTAFPQNTACGVLFHGHENFSSPDLLVILLPQKAVLNIYYLPARDTLG